MSGDAFDELERGLRRAVRREAGVASEPARPAPTRPRRPRRFTRRGGALALVAALVVGGGALAATGALDVGAPLPDEPGPPPTPHVGAGIVEGPTRILPLRVPDPGGGPPWALRTFASSRGGSCVQVGQVLDGRFGRVRPGAGGRLQLRPISATPGQDSLCSFVARNGYPVVRGLRSIEITGGLTDPRQCGGGPCPVTAVRTIRYGLLGPAARRATYLGADGRAGPSQTIDGTHGGAYLFVLRTDPAPYAHTGERGDHGPEPVRDGVRARFADGTVLRVAGHGRTRAALPGVTRRAAAPATSLRATITATHTGDLAHATWTVTFPAPVAIARADHGYTLTVAGRAGRDCSLRTGRGGGEATTRDIARGEAVSFTIGPAFGGGRRTTWCPGVFRFRIGYRSGSGPFRGRLVGAATFTIPHR
jgi:hypothetical protein